MKLIKKIKRSLQAFNSEQNILIPPSTITPSNIQGNQYTSYYTIVNELVKRYQGVGTWGNWIVYSLVRFRSSAISGNGVNVRADKKSDQKWIDDFISENKLDGSAIKDYVTESELEGKALLHILPAKDGKPRVRHLAWTQHNYEVITDATDYEEITGVKIGTGNQTKILKPDTFSYIKISGLRRSVNNPTPRMGMILTEIDYIAKALADIRVSNHYYGVTGIHYKTQTWEDAAQIMDWLASNNIKIGETTAGPADKYFVEPSGSAVNSIKEEINLQLQVVSGVSSVPIHQMGFISLFGTKAGAEELREQIHNGTAMERDTWQEGVKDLILKAAKMDGVELGEFTVTIPMVSLSEIKSLVETMLPLMDAEIISKDTLRESVPGIDPQLEKKRIEKQNETGKKIPFGDQNALNNNTGTDGDIVEGADPPVLRPVPPVQNQRTG